MRKLPLAISLILLTGACGSTQTNSSGTELPTTTSSTAPPDSEVCSTTGQELTLTSQPNLPEPVAAKRKAIFDAAMACDVPALAALTSAEGFTASFGGGDPATLWGDAEQPGGDFLLTLVRHLNLAFSLSTDTEPDDLYIWPSAFNELQASDGTGLSAADYEDLLTIYTVDELDGMFEGIGGYAGYRLGIEADGDWIFYVAGD